jgi:hypothetical protein
MGLFRRRRQGRSLCTLCKKNPRLKKASICRACYNKTVGASARR